MDLTDEQCLRIWRAATKVGAGGPDGHADRVAIGIVRLVLSSPQPESTLLWLLSALNVSSSNSGEPYDRAYKVCADIRFISQVARLLWE